MAQAQSMAMQSTAALGALPDEVPIGELGSLAEHVGRRSMNRTR